MSDVLAWHWVGDKLRNGDSIPSDGETLRWNGPLKLCWTGLHASESILDALSYAQGSTCCRVRCGGKKTRGTDKLVCQKRTILWRVNADCLFREFARMCALDVSSLWNAPPVVIKYLQSENESLLTAVWEASWAAAGTAANRGAKAEVEAARATEVAIRGIVREAAQKAPWAAARAAERAASEAAVWATVWPVLAAAAQTAALQRYNRWLTDMVELMHQQTANAIGEK